MVWYCTVIQLSGGNPIFPLMVRASSVMFDIKNAFLIAL